MRKVASEPKRASVVIIVLIGVVAIVAGELMLFNAGGSRIAALLRWLTVAATDSVGSIGLLLCALFLGLGAFLLRTWILLYASIEIFFGVYGGAIALGLLYRPDQLPPDFQKLADNAAQNPYLTFVALVSAVYVMVRGLVNGLSWVKTKEKEWEERATAKQPIS